MLLTSIYMYTLSKLSGKQNFHFLISSISLKNFLMWTKKIRINMPIFLAFLFLLQSYPLVNNKTVNRDKNPCHTFQFLLYFYAIIYVKLNLIIFFFSDNFSELFFFIYLTWRYTLLDLKNNFMQKKLFFE